MTVIENTSNKKQMVKAFLSETRHKKSLKNMRAYLRHPDYWEALLIIVKYDGNKDYGIGNYIDQIENRTLSQLTIANFLRDEIANGNLVIIEGEKKSRKTLNMSNTLLREFLDHLNFIKKTYLD